MAPSWPLVSSIEIVINMYGHKHAAHPVYQKVKHLNISALKASLSKNDGVKMIISSFTVPLLSKY